MWKVSENVGEWVLQSSTARHCSFVKQLPSSFFITKGLQLSYIFIDFRQTQISTHNDIDASNKSKRCGVDCRFKIKKAVSSPSFSCPSLLQVTPESLFSNLPSILSAHRLFWQEVMYPMLQEVRRTGKPFDPMGLEAGCLQVQYWLSIRSSTMVTYGMKSMGQTEVKGRNGNTGHEFKTCLFTAIFV